MKNIKYPVAPYNNVIVTFPKAFYDSIKFESGVVIYFDPMWSPEEYAMLEGRVVSVPRAIFKRKDYEGFTTEGIERGDKVLVRYDVAFAYAAQPEHDSIRFKNERWWHQKSYWNADIQKVFCVIRDGKYLMLNNYVMCDLIIEYKSDLYTDNIIRPESEKMVVRLDKAKVKAIGKNNLDVAVDDIVTFSPNIPQVYSINRKKFIIISQRHILAVEKKDEISEML